MNRQTTRLIVPFYQREQWDKDREAERVFALHKSDTAFTKHMMELQKEKIAIREASNLIKEFDE